MQARNKKENVIEHLIVTICCLYFDSFYCIPGLNKLFWCYDILETAVMIIIITNTATIITFISHSLWEISKEMWLL